MNDFLFKVVIRIDPEARVGKKVGAVKNRGFATRQSRSVGHSTETKKQWARQKPSAIRV